MTGAYFCTSTAGLSVCDDSPQSLMEEKFAASGMTLSYYFPLDPTSATYTTDLNNAMATISTADVDLLAIQDYQQICIDAIASARALDWTPNGLFFSVCDGDPEVQAAIGDALWYATASTIWSPEAVYQSGISGITNQEFVEEFEEEFQRDIHYLTASAFAGGEILVNVIEQQAAIDVSKVLDTTTLNYLVGNGSFSTILSPDNVSFASNHQVEVNWIQLQYTTAATTAVIDSSTITYPMPSWSDRAVASNDDGNGGTGGTTNNYYGDESKTQATDLVITAMVCFLGGVFMTTGLFMYVMPRMAKSMQNSRTEMITSTANVMGKDIGNEEL